MSKTRKSIELFAFEMEVKLRENDDAKHCWEGTNLLELKDLMMAETEELEDEILLEGSGEDIARECADIANYCMMIADKVKYGTRNRGRE